MATPRSGAGGRASAVTPLAPQAFETTEPYGESTAGEVYRQRTGLDGHRRTRPPRPRPAGPGERRRALRPHHRRARRRARRARGGPSRHRQRRRRAAPGRRTPPRVPARRGERADGQRRTRARRCRRRRAARARTRTHRSDCAWTTTPRTERSRASGAMGASCWSRVPTCSAPISTPSSSPTTKLALQKLAALHRTDELVGRMLADVDPARDAVFVVSPASPRRGSGLAVAGYPRARCRTRVAAFGDQPARRLRLRRRRRADHPRTARRTRRPPTWRGAPMKVVDGGVAHGDRIDFLDRRQSGCGVPRREASATTYNIVIGLSGALALAAFLAVAARAAGARRSPGSSRSRCSGSSSRPTWPGRCTSGARDNVGGVLRVPRRGRGRVRARVPRSSAGRRRYLAARGSRWRPPSCCTSATSSPARASSSTRCSATRRPSGSGCRARATSRSRSSTAAVLLLAGLAVWRRPGRRTVLRGDRHARRSRCW